MKYQNHTVCQLLRQNYCVDGAIKLKNTHLRQMNFDCDTHLVIEQGQSKLVELIPNQCMYFLVAIPDKQEFELPFKLTI